MNNVDPEAPDLKALWAKTGDVRYAAMAIGRWPSGPPIWAVLACCNETMRDEQKTLGGYKKVEDGEVLDEVIRVYFRREDEAQRANPSLRPSEYVAPDQKIVIAEALLNTEGLDQSNDADVDRFRARTVAIERRLMEEEEAENFPERAIDGARETQRYHRILMEWGLEHHGGFSHLHSLALYLRSVIGDNSEGAEV